MYEKKRQISSIICQVLAFMISRVYYSLQYTFSKFHIITIFIFNIIFLNYSIIPRFLSEHLKLKSNRIQTNPFSDIQKELYYLLIFPKLFWKKELENTKNINKITKQKINTNKLITISSIIIGLLVFINIAYFEKLYKKKQNISLFKEITNCLKNPSILPLFSLWLDDNEIIWDAGLGCEKESIDQGWSYVNTNINISLCFFSRYLEYSGHGGVIFVSASSFSMNIFFSMFYNCVCSGNGGAISFSSYNSCLRMICAHSCSCGGTFFGHFAGITAHNVNEIEYLSVSNCSHTTSRYYPIILYFGNQRADNTNSSMNNAEYYSGIGTWLPSSFTSSHCTFSNNKVSNGVCIHFHSTSGTTSMSYANIVHNNSPSSYGVVYVSGAGSRKMMYCIINNNNNYLFCLYGGSLEVSHSFIYHSGSSLSTTVSTSISTSVSTSNNNSFTNTITYQLQFFNSLHCPTDIPPPTRTPDHTPTPKSTLEESPINTLERSPLNTPNETPYSTPEESPDKSLQETIRRTIDQTISETLLNTLNESPMKTLEQSPINTIDQTNRETPKETIPRTYTELICTNQMANKKEISVIFAFVYPVIILMI